MNDRRATLISTLPYFSRLNLLHHNLSILFNKLSSYGKAAYLLLNRGTFLLSFMSRCCIINLISLLHTGSDLGRGTTLGPPPVTYKISNKNVTKKFGTEWEFSILIDSSVRIDSSLDLGIFPQFFIYVYIYVPFYSSLIIVHSTFHV